MSSKVRKCLKSMQRRLVRFSEWCTNSCNQNAEGRKTALNLDETL
ncbi:hypothetical protein GACE_1074 [Geoglobus acetivorans]|uniref:Uncharacterized protein n=1 Tax=Geoglobus acetivorans TaxID=565033 RepID=A0A0A7GE25_GEOAI|nr:hypothetical protein GACE_1074 [Geoglobus acetivorans]